MTFPPPVFVGYFPIKPIEPPDNLDLPGVRLVCSVSHCIVDVPNDWIQQWKHNDLGFYDTPAAAEDVGRSDSGSYELFAYRVFPIQIDGSSVHDFEVPVAPTEDLTSFSLIGFDITTRYAGNFFECSPLSCNSGAKNFDTNQYCLLDSVESALEVAVKMGGGGYEPGPYHIVEVWRQREA